MQRVPATAANAARDNNAISEINTVTRAEQGARCHYRCLSDNFNGLAADIADLWTVQSESLQITFRSHFGVSHVANCS